MGEQCAAGVVQCCLNLESSIANSALVNRRAHFDYRAADSILGVALLPGQPLRHREVLTGLSRAGTPIGRLARLLNAAVSRSP